MRDFWEVIVCDFTEQVWIRTLRRTGSSLTSCAMQSDLLRRPLHHALRSPFPLINTFFNCNFMNYAFLKLHIIPYASVKKTQKMYGSFLKNLYIGVLKQFGCCDIIFGKQTKESDLTRSLLRTSLCFVTLRLRFSSCQTLLLPRFCPAIPPPVVRHMIVRLS